MVPLYPAIMDVSIAFIADVVVPDAVVAAGALCALGVGFLFWKRKSTKKDAGDKYKKAAENYAKQGKFDKAAEMYKKLHKKKRR